MYIYCRKNSIEACLSSYNAQYVYMHIENRSYENLYIMYIEHIENLYKYREPVQISRTCTNIENLCNT